MYLPAFLVLATGLVVDDIVVTEHLQEDGARHG
jgi:hypothetical protein